MCKKSILFQGHNPRLTSRRGLTAGVRGDAELKAEHMSTHQEWKINERNQIKERKYTFLFYKHGCAGV